MKYRTKITSIISQIRNTKKYEFAPILRDATDYYVDVDTEEEAELIATLNYTTEKAIKVYRKLIEITEK